MPSNALSRACLVSVLMMLAAGCGPAAEHAAPASACNSETLTKVLQRATSDDPKVIVDCNLSLPANSIITKRLIVQGSAGSGVTIDCNGATIDGSAVPELQQANTKTDMIQINSTITGHYPNLRWSRPADVTVRNCRIIGSVRILGMTDEADLKYSSYRPGHPTRMHLIAPTNITLDNLTITARTRTPVYFGIGVTDSKLINSELKGKAVSVAIYLDAESSGNLIKNNNIHTITAPREVLAVDSSDNNTIIDNRFSALNTGGIYLYRNCGQDGIVRQTTPSYNTIVNNVFYYDKYNPLPFAARPSVYMGARNGNKSYCNDDASHPIGSGASNLDYAQHNVVMQNQIYKLPVSLMIREGKGTDSPNYIEYNTSVTTPVARLAGCYVGSGYAKDFIVHGESIEMSGRRYTCNDGDLHARTGRASRSGRWSPSPARRSPPPAARAQGGWALRRWCRPGR